MCTTIGITTNDFYFGRNMDLEYSFGERVVMMPRRFPLAFRRAGRLESHYAILGMATVAQGCPLYADGMNEKGLCMAGLNFPNNACFFKKEVEGKHNVAPFELIPWVLSQCADISEARSLLADTPLVDIPFSQQMPNAPLHWHIAGQDGSLVLESTKEGIQLYDNPAGVLTNNPGFPYQLTNLGLYLNLTVDRPNNCFSRNLGIDPFGLGLGSHGLPGDYSPTSRFVKAAFLGQNSHCPKDEPSSVSQMFHLLDTVSVARGSVITPEKKWSITTYSACMSAAHGVYYYKTYTNNSLTAIDMHREALDSEELREFPLATTQQVFWAN